MGRNKSRQFKRWPVIAIVCAIALCCALGYVVSPVRAFLISQTDAMGIFFGLAVTYLLGFGVKPLVDNTVKAPQRPKDAKDVAAREKWKAWEAISHGHPDLNVGEALGKFERFLSFLAFTVSEYTPTLLAGWLVFKVGSKWESWKNIVQVPIDNPDFSPTAWYQARLTFGSYVLGRFQLGVLANIVVGAVGAFVGPYATKLLETYTRVYVAL